MTKDQYIAALEDIEKQIQDGLITKKEAREQELWIRSIYQQKGAYNK